VLNGVLKKKILNSVPKLLKGVSAENKIEHIITGIYSNIRNIPDFLFYNMSKYYYLGIFKKS